jgi:hypothetical protein
VKARWTRSSTESFSSVEELQTLIEKVRRLGRPTLVCLERDDKTLAFGVGAPESVLVWMDSDKTTWHSVGDLSRKGHIQLWNCDQLDDFLAELAVPEEVGIDAAMSFAMSGERPDNVRWESDG